MKTTAHRGKVGWGGGWGGDKVLHQLFSLMCVVCHKGWPRWGFGGGVGGGISTSLDVNGLERVVRVQSGGHGPKKRTSGFYRLFRLSCGLVECLEK